MCVRDDIMDERIRQWDYQWFSNIRLMFSAEEMM